MAKFYQTLGLKEDVFSPGIGVCSGCISELALRFTMRVLGKDAVLFSAPGCSASLPGSSENGYCAHIACYMCLYDNVASSMTGVYRYYKSIGREVMLVAFVGDGATADIGLQALSGAAERQDNFIYICTDNEGYMNTGGQRSSSTPQWTRTANTPVGKVRHGKEQRSKYLPLIMLDHEIPYVATASMAYPKDYAQKLRKAMNIKDGLCYLHLLSPCIPTWGYSADQGIKVSRMAVETNYFPLWEAEYGRVRLTKEVTNPKPVQEYTRLLRKYSHLTEQDLIQVQEMVNKRYRKIKGLALLDLDNEERLCK